MSNIAIIVDLETTGLNSSFDEIIEIGAIKVDLDTGETLAEFQTFSKPEDSLPPFIEKLTGIDSKMLKDAPDNVQAVNAFLAFAENLPIWAYSANFDSGFINNFTDEHRPFKDILTLARRAFPNLKNHKLITVAEHLGLSTENSHRAIADCNVSKEVLLLGLEYQTKTPKNFKANEKGIFFGKVLVFTGELETMTRNTAMSHASLYGFKIGSGVTKKTDCLVVGTQDLDKLAGHEKSSKHRKAEKLIDDGINIQIISENNFLKIIQSD